MRIDGKMDITNLVQKSKETTSKDTSKETSKETKSFDDVLKNNLDSSKKQTEDISKNEDQEVKQNTAEPVQDKEAVKNSDTKELSNSNEEIVQSAKGEEPKVEKDLAQDEQAEEPVIQDVQALEPKLEEDAVQNIQITEVAEEIAKIEEPDVAENLIQAEDNAKIKDLEAFKSVVNSKSVDKVNVEEPLQQIQGEVIKIEDTKKVESTKEDITLDSKESDEATDLDLEQVINILAQIPQTLKDIKTEDTSKLDISILKEVILDRVKSIAHKETLNTLSDSLTKAYDVQNIESTLNNLVVSLQDEGTKDLLNTEDIDMIQGLLKQLGIKVNEAKGEVTTNNSNLNAEHIETLPVDTKINTEETKVIKEQLAVVENLVNEVKTVLEKITKDTKGVDAQVKTVNIFEVKNENTNTNTDSEKHDELSKNLQKEEKILSSILNEEDTSKVNRLTSFTNTFNSVSNVQTEKAVPTVSKGTFTEDVIKSVKYMEVNNLKELVVKMNPKDLGEISIKVVQEEGILKATIKASSKETYSMLSQNLQVLQKELSSQEIKIQSIDISLNEDTTYFKGQGFENNSANDGQSNLNSGSKNSNVGTIGEDVAEEDDAEILSNIDMLA